MLLYIGRIYRIDVCVWHLANIPRPPIDDNNVLRAQSRQKSLKRIGDNSVYRTVCWMLRWPR
jgi:hypothetical protein